MHGKVAVFDVVFLYLKFSYFVNYNNKHNVEVNSCTSNIAFSNVRKYVTRAFVIDCSTDLSFVLRRGLANESGENSHKILTSFHHCFGFIFIFSAKDFTF